MTPTVGFAPELSRLEHAIRVNLFAGGGGASEGERMATGRSPTIALNHSPVAIAMHRANHPDSTHYIEDVYAVDPREVTGGREVELLWASPTCTHFSRARGGELLDQKIRGLAWAILPWIVHARPRVIVVENVPEFLTWGPLCRQHAPDCPAGDSGATKVKCAKHCRFGRPIKARAGETFRAWRRKIESKGYSVEARTLVAWEYGAPTTRERTYIVMRADGQPATWPAPTHAPEPTPERPNRWRTAADVIDWSMPCPSIFDRRRPLVRNTLARIVRGVGKFVLQAARPFVLKVKTHGGGGNEPTSVDAPLRTITASKRGELAVGTAFLAKHYSERRPDEVMGQDLARPMGTVTAKDHHALVCASIVKFYGTATGSAADAPLHAVTADGLKHGLSAAFLSRYNGESVGQMPDAPIGTLDTHDRYAVASARLADRGQVSEWTPEVERRARLVYRLMVDHGYAGPGLDHQRQIVVVRIDGQAFVIWDLGMRMLTPRELFSAQGFGPEYVIDPIGPRGKRLTSTEQVRACGNSVCPPVARAIIEAALGIRRMPEAQPN